MEVWLEQNDMLLFNTSYVQVIEKLSVSLGGKYPDFILLNVYNYLDIYEIKKPSTQLMKRKPYRAGVYGVHSEISQAVTQVLDQALQLTRHDRV